MNTSSRASTSSPIMFSRTDTLLNTLMLYSINTGLVTRFVLPNRFSSSPHSQP